MMVKKRSKYCGVISTTRMKKLSRTAKGRKKLRECGIRPYGKKEKIDWSKYRKEFERFDAKNMKIIYRVVRRS